MEAGPDIGLWLAGIFGTALVTVLGIIATAVMREKKAPASTSTRWQEERGAILLRLQNLEEEHGRWRAWKHDVLAPWQMEQTKKISDLEYENRRLKKERDE